MSSEFQEKLQLYKEGKLNQEEVAEIESEIDKFIAISDYLNNDEKEFLEELKHQLTISAKEENKTAKLLKRKVNVRIIMTTVFSIFMVILVSSFLISTASRLTSSWFGLDYKESYVKRAEMVQLAQMFQPKYKPYESSVSASRFAQQNIRVYLKNTLGNTKVDETEIRVGYSFGKPVRLREEAVPPLVFENFHHFTAHEPNPLSGFKVLEKAPQGTKAKILVEFNKALTAQEIKEHFMDKIDNMDAEPLDIAPIAGIGSDFVLANTSYYLCTTTFPYDKNNLKQQKDNASKQEQYVKMDNQAHKESLIGNLNLIKNNLSLLQAMYYEDMFENVDFDNMIKQVEDSGAEYIGMYISADSKELLKLKNSPYIHCMGVEDLVIW